jgi:transcriptional regulator with XRE-family HTH domain
MTFGERVKSLRLERGLTQTTLAEKAGLSLHGIGQLERSRREPSWATVQAIAKALGVDCTAFADQEGGE